jgi:DMSO/TMAO reductase YedYZ molybdopterin-dependent catalytic subunit
MVTGLTAGTAALTANAAVAQVMPQPAIPAAIVDPITTASLKTVTPSPHCAPVQATRKPTNFIKDTSRLLDLNATNQGGQYWRYSTLITPVEDFFVRNEYATPTAATDRRVDPRFWQLKIHGDGVERPLTLSYADLLKLPSRSIISKA